MDHTLKKKLKRASPSCIDSNKWFTLRTKLFNCFVLFFCFAKETWRSSLCTSLNFGWFTS